MAVRENISAGVNVKRTGMCTGRRRYSRNQDAATVAEEEGWEERVTGQVQNTKCRPFNPQKAVVFNRG